MLFEAVALAICARLALRFLAVDSVARLLGRMPGRRRPGLRAIDECMEAASVAASRAAHPTCLYRSLIALGLLARRGHAVAIHIGASREGGFSAHAWVTVGGVPVDAPQPRVYVALWRHAAGSARS
jgi:hypothetical protein